MSPSSGAVIAPSSYAASRGCVVSLNMRMRRRGVGPSNDYCITRSPDSSAETHRGARQTGAVKLMRVRRATAPGSNDLSENKAAEFMQELASTRSGLPA